VGSENEGGGILSLKPIPKKLTTEQADEMIREGRSPAAEGYEVESPQEWLIRHIYENTRRPGA
jgi:hypothetical protein